MKFQSDPAPATAIRAYGPGWIALAGRGERITTSVILSATQSEPWAVERFEDLTQHHFAPLVAHRPELVIFGSGARLRFLPPTCLRTLIDAGIGVETMDTPAACRTWNVLLGEGRQALAALLLEPQP